MLLNNVALVSLGFGRNCAASLLANVGAFQRRYVELENKQSWHLKASLVHQEAESRYQLTETQLGGMTTRHDLNVNQVIKCYTLCRIFPLKHQHFQADSSRL